MSDSIERNETALSRFFETLAKKLAQLLFWPNRAALILGGFALALITTITAIDVTLRNLAATIVPGGAEIIGLVTTLVVLAALATVELERGHIRVDMLLNAMNERFRDGMVVGGLILTFALMAVTAVQILEQSQHLLRNQLVTGRLEVPLWPFVGAAAFYVLLFLLALLSNFAERFANVLRKGGLLGLLIVCGWLLLSFMIVAVALDPALMPFEVSRTVKGIACIVLCFILIFLGVHVASGMAVSAFLGISLLITPMASLTSLGTTTVAVVSDPIWSVVPLFTWMGFIIVASGFADDLFRAAYRWIGHLPGGLASASTMACAGLSSIVGDTLTGVYAMGSIALPQMEKYKYDMKLATASIACSATIGVLIPPSIAFIVYGMITQVSIGKLFMAGVIPGILFAVILIGLITIRAWLDPAIAPRGEVSTWQQRREAGAQTWPILLLIFVVLGGIYTGAVTPNEAGGLGVVGALGIGLVTKRLSLSGMWHALEKALRLTAGIILIFMFATVFSRFIALSGFTAELGQLVTDLDLGKYQLMAAILVFYVLIGMFMNALPALVLTVPLFFPLVMSAGFDPIWFGVVVVVMVELGVVTPPIGMNVFAIASIAKGVSMYEVFVGVMPFWIAFVLLIILLIAFPQISLFLPSLM